MVIYNPWQGENVTAYVVKEPWRTLNVCFIEKVVHRSRLLQTKCRKFITGYKKWERIMVGVVVALRNLSVNPDAKILLLVIYKNTII